MSFLSNPDVQSAIVALLLALITAFTGWRAKTGNDKANDDRLASVMDKAVTAAVNLTPGMSPGVPATLEQIVPAMQNVAAHVVKIAPELAEAALEGFGDRVLGRLSIDDQPAGQILENVRRGAAVAASILVRKR